MLNRRGKKLSYRFDTCRDAIPGLLLVGIRIPEGLFRLLGLESRRAGTELYRGEAHRRTGNSTDGHYLNYTTVGDGVGKKLV